MAATKLIDTTSARVVGDAALKLNLRHLQAFCAVAVAGSVTRAAEASFRVASAVTRAVAGMEAALGVPLFERKARGMLPNAYGKAVLLRAERIEREFAMASQELAQGSAAQALDARSLMAAMFSGRRLALFASLSDLRNMPAAARAFGVTQPALTAFVRELEARAACTLFTRSARGVVPTRAGTQLAFRCKRALAELRSIDSDVAGIRGVVQGSVVVGALPLSRTLVLPEAVAGLLARFPRVHVSTVESPYEVLAAALRSGDVDFILGALRPAAEARDLLQEPLFDDYISLVVRSGHPLASKRRIGFGDLQRARWVLSRPGAPSRELLERFFHQSGRALPAPAVETGDLALLRGLLLKSDMVTAISAQQLHYEIEAGMLRVLDFPLATTRREIGIAQRHGALPAPSVLALIAEVRGAVEKLPVH